MSHASAEIIHNSSVIGHSEYNGTSDTMQWNSWYDNAAEVQLHWREDYHTRIWPACGCVGVDALIYASYGDGFYWTSEVCLVHRVIRQLTAWNDETETGSIDGPPLGV